MRVQGLDMTVAVKRDRGEIVLWFVTGFCVLGSLVSLALLWYLFSA